MLLLFEIWNLDTEAKGLLPLLFPPPHNDTLSLD